jgi:multidrug efflux pump subunit AcrA (membrane-fusion protein)
MKKLKMPKSPCNYFIFPLILSAAVILPCCKNSGSKSAEDKIEARTPVTIVSVSDKPISETIDLSAVSVFMNKNIIRSATTGTIEDISVTPGDFVGRNQLLFTVKTREAMAVQNTQSGDSSLNFKGIIKIFSPKEGIISSISHQNGDFVQDGDELAVIAEQNSLVFILEVPFEFKSLIEKRNSCSLKLPDNSVITGIIKGKLPEMNVQAQTISYLVKPVTSSRLPQNLIAVASIIKNSKENAAVLPKPAVLGNEALTEFWVMKLVNDSTAVKVIVKKGIETNNEVEITDPVFNPSDRVILTGNYGLPDTSSIIIMK